MALADGTGDPLGQATGATYMVKEATQVSRETPCFLQSSALCSVRHNLLSEA